MKGDDPFDPSALRLTRSPVLEAARPAGRPPRPLKGEAFLKGPVPWRWLEVAAGLPGRALAAGMVVWFEAGCKKSWTVRVTLARLARLGMSPSTARRALRTLAANGLIAMTARPGRATEVTLLDTTATETR